MNFPAYSLEVMAQHYPKGRADHYLPQGYLAGFIDPAKPATESQPLWVFYTERKKWRKTSTSQIGWAEGFYDFAYRQGDREHAEKAFSELENGFPPLIQQLRATGFREWRQHANFLLRYLQMIRCRSPLFREQFMSQWREKQAARVIGYEPKSTRIDVDSLKLRRFSPGALKEGALNAMVSEMKSGIAIFESFHWQIRLADSVQDSFVTSDHPLLFWTPEGGSFDHRSSEMIFPLCWEACLVGRRDPFSLRFGQTTTQERHSIRHTYLINAKRFVVSPHRLF